MVGTISVMAWSLAFWVGGICSQHDCDGYKAMARGQRSISVGKDGPGHTRQQKRTVISSLDSWEAAPRKCEDLPRHWYWLAVRAGLA